MKSIYGLEIIANIVLNKAINEKGEKIYPILYKTYFRTLQCHYCEIAIENNINCNNWEAKVPRHQ